MRELGSTHVVDITSQEEEEHKSNVASSTPGTTMPVSKPGSTDDDDPNTRINNESTSVQPQPYRRKRSCFDLINGSKKEYLEICVPLYKAAITSDWESAKVILDKRPELVRYAITQGGDTILHIAVSAEDIILAEKFVDNLLNKMEVERMIPPYLRYLKNTDGKTAYELFSENNQELVSKGLKWTKDCMVVTTLIITVAFAAAFTVPGGYDQETGIPIFNPETSFLVFMIADGVSLFSSSTSLLVFLSILTSPHGQHHFLYSLPKKLMIGLVTLFISVAAMMVTFAASFFVLYRNTHKWLPTLISILAATPVIIFAALQYPLLMDMFRSMYDSRYLFNPRRRVLYKRKMD
ncbi:ankyrin repeat-containing domain, PGG domain protein [Artemisia annua]|uniref:Ankyrin repeat-containing domain, PGG domain protein n=1 Tax=Artemisia annua TaxID=35608 RepID=A0A2U1NXP3_ARTAN|nr:ankyrin repeat-containing domain, PGG domain protein [Artemisia annua]